MGGDHHRDPALRELIDEVPELAAAHGIDAARGFVEEDHLRTVEHRAPKCQPLLPSARQGPGQEVLPPPEAGEGDPLLRAVPRLGPGQAVDARIERQVLRNGQVVVEAEPLGHVPDALLDALRISDHVVPEHLGPPLARLQDPAQHPDGGGLPGTVGPQEPPDRPPGDLEAHVIDRHERPEPAGEPLRANGERRGLRHQPAPPQEPRPVAPGSSRRRRLLALGGPAGLPPGWPPAPQAGASGPESRNPHRPR